MTVTSWLERIGRDGVQLDDAHPPAPVRPRRSLDGPAGTGGTAHSSARDGAAPLESRFTDLYREHYPFVLRFALRRLRALDAAQDATVATFAVVWSRFDEVPEVPRAWIYRIARSVVSLELRQRMRDERLRGEPGSSRLRLTENELSGDPVLRAVSELQDDDREVLQLRAWEDLSGAEIGEVLGCSPGDVAVRLHEAQQRLKDLLGSLERPEPAEQPDPAGRRAGPRTSAVPGARNRRNGSATRRVPR
ncbi:MAG TPA: sigma-70 family RNA polymerase sigma factor [Actinomycetales bacterium]|nr:sigma-70 family RNA polymerase sigma factor [Actinomycetales bacterium]